MSRNRSDSGEFVESVTLAAVADVFNEVEGPVVTSGDVADALGCSRETARRKLKELHEKGRVSRRKTAGRVVWWLASELAFGSPEDEDIESAADRVGGRGLFAGEDGEAFADAVEASREEFDEDYEERHDDLFGQ